MRRVELADEIDLETGRTPGGRRRRQETSTATDSTSESKTTGDRIDRELRTRLNEAFDQVVEWRQAREDVELAAAIAEDKDKMSRGLVSLTHAIVPLRKPLLIFLAFVEPLLAFGRVGRILAGRWFDRRQARADELAQRQAEWDAAHNVTATPWNEPAPAA